jgi:Uma2 family endonuclease
VLSSSTREYDRGGTFELYRGRDSLSEYVLVETERMAMNMRRREDEQIWITETYGPGDTVLLSDLDLAIPIVAFYRGLLSSEGSRVD